LRNRRVEAETIRSYFKRGPSGRIEAPQVDAALKSLYATGLFQDVQIRQAGGKIYVRVMENAVINRVAFEGNYKAKDDFVNRYVSFGSSPRGGQTLMLGAKVFALLDGRANVSYDDVDRIAVPTLSPMPAGLGEVSRVQTFCAPGPTYILKVGPLVIDSVPVQSGFTV
jgi:MoxR-like ATPase